MMKKLILFIAVLVMFCGVCVYAGKCSRDEARLNNIKFRWDTCYANCESKYHDSKSAIKNCKEYDCDPKYTYLMTKAAATCIIDCSLVGKKCRWKQYVSAAKRDELQKLVDEEVRSKKCE